jgi:hypothetical protein
MISYKCGCIFVHIPKTGGTSIERIIWPGNDDRCAGNLCMGLVDGFHNKYQTGGLQHLLARQIREEVGREVFDKFFKFSIVRNPWDKAISQYIYMGERGDLRRFIGLSETDSFKKYLELIQKRTHVQWESQHKFILDESGQEMVDYIGRFERFNDEVSRILQEIKARNGVEIRIDDIPHLKKSNRSHYRDYYDSEAREMVAHIYKKDIEYFGYTF